MKYNLIIDFRAIYKYIFYHSVNNLEYLYFVLISEYNFSASNDFTINCCLNFNLFSILNVV